MGQITESAVNRAAAGARTRMTRLTFMGMMIAVGVIISPILRVEGMCPMAHLINITCAVFIGPVYAFICALLIGILRMIFMGIPPLALTGAVFGAFLSGMLYRLTKGKLIWAFLGEVIGTGIIGAIISYPVMTYLWGRNGLSWMFYVPSFIAGTLIGGSIAFFMLTKMQKTGMVAKIQTALGSDVFVGGNEVFNNAVGIGVLGIIGYLVVFVIVKNFVTDPSPLVNSLKFIVLVAFAAAGVLYWGANHGKK